MTIGDRIQDIRMSSHMSQEQFATELSVSRQSVSRWELNQSIPDVERLIAISKLFQVSTDYLLMGIPPTSSNNEDLSANETASNSTESDEQALTTELIQQNTNLSKGKKYLLYIGSFIVLMLSVLLIGIGLQGCIKNSSNKINFNNQTICFVDQINRQYTKAEISFSKGDDNFQSKSVYLDTKGVTQGDILIAYQDGDDVIVPTSPLLSICLLCLGIALLIIIFAIMFLRRKKKPFTAVFFLALIIFVASVYFGVQTPTSNNKYVFAEASDGIYIDNAKINIPDNFLYKCKPNSLVFSGRDMDWYMNVYVLPISYTSLYNALDNKKDTLPKIVHASSEINETTYNGHTYIYYSYNDGLGTQYTTFYSALDDTKSLELNAYLADINPEDFIKQLDKLF